MSDPITNVDVENVLTSIRRLVSEANSDRRNEQPTQGKLEALLLTSDQRIDDRLEMQPEVPESESSAGLGTTGGRLHLSQVEPDDNQDPWQIDRDQDSIRETDVPSDYYEDDEAASMSGFFRRHQADVPEAEMGEPAFFEFQPQSDRVTGHDPVVSELSSDDLEGAQIVEHSEIIAVEQFESDLELETVEETETPQNGQVFSFTGGKLEPSDPHIEAGDVQDFGSDSINEIDESGSPAYEDVPTENSEFAELEEDAADQIELGGDSQLPEVPLEAVDGHSVGQSSHSIPLDLSQLEDDVLRDIVGEIVREELAGVLGERITRNVRKLVRREIHRAMLTREFD